MSGSCYFLLSSLLLYFPVYFKILRTYFSKSLLGFMVSTLLQLRKDKAGEGATTSQDSYISLQIENKRFVSTPWYITFSREASSIFIWQWRGDWQRRCRTCLLAAIILDVFTVLWCDNWITQASLFFCRYSVRSVALWICQLIMILSSVMELVSVDFTSCVWSHLC